MLKHIKLDLIDPNPDQPRKTFEALKLRELADSIQENGLLQPITVRPVEAGRFQIVMGERRYRAHQLLADDGEVTTVLCQIKKSLTDRERDIQAIVENGQRRDVTPIEEGRSYQRMMDEYGMTVDEVAKVVSKQPFRIRERLKLLGLSPDSVELFKTGILNRTQAYEMADLEAASQARLAKVIAQGGVPTDKALKAAVDALKTEETQGRMFADLPETKNEDREKLSRLEKAVERVEGVLTAGFKDGEVIAAKTVDPGRAATLSQRIGLIAKHLQQLQDDLDAASAIGELAAA